MSEQTTENNAAPARNGSKKRRVRLLLIGFIVAAVIIGFWMWYKSQTEVSTDNAFIHSTVHLVSARVAGQVSRVMVDDNQRVEAGDLLVVLNPDIYQVEYDKAKARLAMAKNETSAEYAQVEEAKAALQRAEAGRDQAQRDLKRGEALAAREVIPQEQLEQLKTAAKVADAQLQQAREALRRTRAMIGAAADGNVEARVAQRAAELSAAELKLVYTRVAAPAAGYVTRKSVELGNNIQPGQPLLAVVELDHPWIEANLKEGQLTHIEPGQKVDFTVDAYPGKTFSGQVESIMAGTGAAFSLLPPENATGNYVKVVQRVPVRISIDPESDPEHQLRVGMSVEPKIHTGRGLGDILAHLNPF